MASLFIFVSLPLADHGFTFDNNPQLHHVDDKLETVTDDEDSNNTNEDGGNHKVSSLSFAQAAQTGTSCSWGGNVERIK